MTPELDRITRLERQVELLTRQVAGLPVRLGDVPASRQPQQLAVVVEVMCTLASEDRYLLDPGDPFDFSLNPSVIVRLALLNLAVRPGGVLSIPADELDANTFFAFDVRRDGTPTVGEVVKVWTSDGKPARPGENFYDDTSSCDTSILGPNDGAVRHEIYCDTINTTDYLRGLPTWDQPTTQYLYHEADSYLLEWVEASPGGGGATLVEGCGIDLSGTDPITISVLASALEGDGLVNSSGCLLAVGAGLGISVDANSVGLFNTNFDSSPPPTGQVYGHASGVFKHFSINDDSGLEIDGNDLQLHDDLYDDTTANLVQVYAHGNNDDFFWTTAYTVKSTGLDTGDDYLHDALTNTTAAGTFNSTQDIEVWNQTDGAAMTDQTEGLFIDSSTIDGWTTSGKIVLGAIDGAVQWTTDDTGGGGGTGHFVQQGCGINFTGLGTVVSPYVIAVDVSQLDGAGLETDTSGGICELKVKIANGGGLQFASDGDTLMVDAADLIGDGLEEDAGNQDDADGPVKLKAKLGCGLTFSTDGTPKSIILDVANIIGDGLGEQSGNQDDANGPCKIKVATNKTIKNITALAFDFVGSTLEVKITYENVDVYGVTGTTGLTLTDSVTTTDCS